MGGLFAFVLGFLVGSFGVSWVAWQRWHHRCAECRYRLGSRLALEGRRRANGPANPTDDW